MTTFNLQAKNSTSAFGTPQSKGTTPSFTLVNRDMGKSLLLKEDGGLLLTEDGSGIILEQSLQGDAWTNQPKS